MRKTKETDYYFVGPDGTIMVRAFSLNDATEIYMRKHNCFTARYTRAQYERMIENEEE